MRPGGVNDVMHRKRTWRILGIWEKSVSWVFASEEEGWLSELAKALRGVCVCVCVCVCVPHVVVVVVGADRKASTKRLCISLLMSKNLLTQR